MLLVAQLALGYHVMLVAESRMRAGWFQTCDLSRDRLERAKAVARAWTLKGL
jgi:hypothetical protein